jgi:hypothetical protein
MNIFVLDSNPALAARMLADKHVPKMLLESAQLLCSPFEPGQAPYKRTHYNHPCSVWVRESYGNYSWLLDHAYSISDEFLKRFGKNHKSLAVIDWCQNNIDALIFDKQELTPFALAMPEQYRSEDAVLSYRNYYLNEKASFAKWAKGTPQPDWWDI